MVLEHHQVLATLEQILFHISLFVVVCAGQLPVCWPNDLDEHRSFFSCYFCTVRSVRELARNSRGSLGSYYGFVCVFMPLLRRKCGFK